MSEMVYPQEYLIKTKRLDPELMQLLADPEACGFDLQTEAGRRNHIMIQVMRQTGMRCVELHRLRAENLIDRPDGSIRVRFVGKGRRERLAIIRNGVAAELRRYVAGRHLKPEAPVFPALDSHGTPTAAPVSTDAIYQVIRKLGRRLGTKIHPQQIRHTFISELIDAGVPIGQVMKLAGHSQMATTQLYYHSNESLLDEAYGKLPAFMG